MLFNLGPNWTTVQITGPSYTVREGRGLLCLDGIFLRVVQVSDEICRSDEGWQTPTRIMFSPLRDSFHHSATHSAGRCTTPDWADVCERYAACSSIDFVLIRDRCSGAHPGERVAGPVAYAPKCWRRPKFYILYLMLKAYWRWCAAIIPWIYLPRKLPLVGYRVRITG